MQQWRASIEALRARAIAVPRLPSAAWLTFAQRASRLFQSGFECGSTRDTMWACCSQSLHAFPGRCLLGVATFGLKTLKLRTRCRWPTPTQTGGCSTKQPPTTLRTACVCERSPGRTITCRAAGGRRGRRLAKGQPPRASHKGKTRRAVSPAGVAYGHASYVQYSASGPHAPLSATPLGAGRIGTQHRGDPKARHITRPALRPAHILS